MKHAKRNKTDPAADSPQIIISASRRTDIPAFYNQWLVETLAHGQVDRINPFNRQVRQFAATPDKIHTLVLWSKNFGPLIASRHDRILQRRGYNLFFNFSINSPNADLEPHLPSLDQRLAQLSHLAQTFGPETINWRFDPICVYRVGNGPRHHNLDAFALIAQKVGDLGITTCITSFVDLYAKVLRRSKSVNLYFELLSPEAQCRTLMDLAHLAQPQGLALQTCCEKAVLENLPPGTGISAAQCISAERLMALYGPGIEARPDAGQRRQQGCGCSQAVDIGDYWQHPCAHNCWFCYANPVAPTPNQMARINGTKAGKVK